MSKFIREVTILVFMLVAVSLFAYAQLVPDPVSLVASPSSPAPGAKFTVEASTPTFDKNTANFSWQIDGQTRNDLSGPGRNTITSTAGGVGTSVRVNVEVSTPQGLGGETSLVVRVSDLSLTWFAETYTPKWYKGKALPVPGSVVNIVAVPQINLGGRALKPQDLIYRWTLDDQEDALTGVGEQIFRVRTSQFPRNSHHIRVAIEDPSGQIRQEGEIFILSTEPRVVIYNATPLGGPEVRSAPLLRTAGRDETKDFMAEPFYFPVASKKSLPFRWNVAGSDLAGNAGKEFSITLSMRSLPLQITPILVTVPLADSIFPIISGTLTIFLP